jgi:hypothetical protein
MPAFTAIEDVPLVVRHARKFPAQVGCWAQCVADCTRWQHLCTAAAPITPPFHCNVSSVLHHTVLLLVSRA